MDIEKYEAAGNVDFFDRGRRPISVEKQLPHYE